MDEDASQHDVDTRLREILKPPDPASARVVSGALGRQQSRTPMQRWRWAAVTAAVLLISAAVTWQRAGLRQSAIPITTATPRSGGHYVILVPASEVGR